jgi:2-amino-4-hydroxy-6-hydroxymethyldihydropteridine diphosphokinase
VTAAYLALGSNLEPRESYLNRALERLKALGTIEKIAPLYQSEPYGVSDQPHFLNSAVLLETELQPRELLQALKKIERDLGRQTRRRWGPREIDIDIIFYGDKIIRESDLHIPHDDYRNRRFVLQPLLYLQPNLTSPDTHETLRQLFKNCPDNSKLTVFKKSWVTNGTQL